MQTSWAFLVISFPPMRMSVTRSVPLSGIVQTSAPVSTTTAWPSFVTFSAPAAVVAFAAAPEAGESVNGSLTPAGITVAKPVHFTDPSGQ